MWHNRQEERFQRITRLAARLLDVPISMINLVGDEQLTRAAHGIDADVIPLADSFCARAVEMGDHFEVGDLLADARFRDNVFVTAPHDLRFYAAEPLRIGAVPIGTLCVLDDQPRTLTGDQLEVLRELAGWAEAELNNTALNELAHEAQRREALTRAILNGAGDGIVASGADGTVMLANPAALTMLGWEGSDLVGRTLHEVAHHTRPDGTPYPVDQCPSHRAIDLGRSMAPHEDLFWRRDGSPLPIEMTVTSMTTSPSEEPGGAVTVFRDISERQQVQRLKDEFVGVVSHELRTPLTAIIGFLKLLEGGVATPLAEQQKPLVAMALSNSLRLGSLVDDILDLDRLDAGRMPLRPAPVDAVELARTVVEQLGGTATVDDVALTLDVEQSPLVVTVDAARVSQALTNLVGNALKFTPAGGSVRVVARHDAAEVLLQVIDTGVGIAEEDRATLFQRFQQVGGAQPGRRKGTGLGLSIAKGIVEQSGGRIDVTSTPGEGSTFTIALPASDTTEEGAT